MHTATSPSRTPSRSSRPVNEVPQPGRRSTPLAQSASIVDTPPPQVPDDCACDAGSCGPRTRHYEVHGDERVGEVHKRDGDEAEERGLGARGCEARRKVCQAHKQGTRVYEGAEGNVHSLTDFSEHV